MPDPRGPLSVAGKRDRGRERWRAGEVQEQMWTDLSVKLICALDRVNSKQLNHL